jgi:hypothetical protein
MTTDKRAGSSDSSQARQRRASRPQNAAHIIGEFAETDVVTIGGGPGGYTAFLLLNLA